MNSFNHYAYGSCGDFMYRYLAGINADPAVPGYKHIVLRPRPHRAIKHVRATYTSHYGPIASHWQLHDHALTWDVAVPPNTTATAHIPGGKTEFLVPGKYSFKGTI